MPAQAARSGTSTSTRRGEATRSALIIVTAIYVSGGGFLTGIVNTLVFGLVGIVAQVIAVRGLEYVSRLDVGTCLHDEGYTPVSAMIAGMHVALGLVVAVAII